MFYLNLMRIKTWEIGKPFIRTRFFIKASCLFQFQSEMETRNGRTSLDISEPLYGDSSRREILKWN